MDIPSVNNFSRIQNTFFFGLLAIVTVVFVWLIKDFLMPVFWAIVLGIVFYPVHLKWLKILRYKSLASLVTLFTILIIVFVPLWIIGGLVVDESVRVYNQFSGFDIASSQTSLIERTAVVLGYIEPLNISESHIKEKLVVFAQATTSWLAGQAVVIGQATLSIVVSFFVMLYLLFFILKDGPSISARIKRVLPLGEDREQALITNVANITRSIFKGTLIIALIQGTIGGILFWIAGIEGALLWGVVMTLLSIIPAIGPGVVWFPAGIILLLTGSVWEGALILAGGIFLVSVIDNVLRPLLVGRGARIPDAIVLLATLGGLALFGIAGFIIGPIIAGLFLSLWRIFEVDYEKELEIIG
jgi:predicted PurR-regulated permease PerM